MTGKADESPFCLLCGLLNPIFSRINEGRLCTDPCYWMWARMSDTERVEMLAQGALIDGRDDADG